MSWRNLNHGVAPRLVRIYHNGQWPVLRKSPPWMPVSSQPATVDRVRHRKFLTSALPAVLIPPVVFVSLVITLWTYKCAMMVVFQNKIIYMPYVPLGARKEKILDYARACGPVQWSEERIQTPDGKKIALCVAKAEAGSAAPTIGQKKRHVVILYCQGNASSLPPRLPFLSQVLQDISRNQSSKAVAHTLVALSYRGYWTSQGRPSQSGIEMDVAAALAWVEQNLIQDKSEVFIVLWGQSIGAGVASTAAAKWMGREKSSGSLVKRRLSIHGLILETPFTSIRDMLVALYPQRWLPYQYLGPFLRNWWDSRAALTALSTSVQANSESRYTKRMKLLVLQAGNDELVPASHGVELGTLGEELGFDVSRIVIPNALHTEIIAKQDGRKALSDFLGSFK